MLIYTPKIKYHIYPSWADFTYKWADLPLIFDRIYTDPEKYINQYIHPQWYNEHNKIYYTLINEGLEFINGPVGGGIIIHKYTSRDEALNAGGYAHKKMWIGQALFNIEQYNMESISGAEIIGYPLNISYWHRNNIPLLVNLGIEKRSNKQYRIDGSYDHVESVGNNIYVALVCYRHKRQKTDMIQDFIELVTHFNLNLTYIEKTPETILKEKPFWFTKEKDVFHWFQLHTDIIQVQRITSFLIYCTLHLRVKNSSLWGFQLAAQIEGKPQGNLFKIEKHGYSVLSKDFIERWKQSHSM
jgi:hypothetical protein